MKLCAVLAIACVACGGGSRARGDGGSVGVDAPPLTGDPGGFITYTSEDKVFRISATPGNAAISVSDELDDIAPGMVDEAPAMSRSGTFMTLSTRRFSNLCSGQACLTRIDGDLSAGEAVIVGGQPVRAEGRGAITDDGELIVFPGDDGPHQVDLFSIRRSGSAWAAPELLTADSTHAFNNRPVLSRDESKVLFDCGPDPFSGDGTGVCEIGVDGTGFRRVIAPTDMGSADSNAKHGDYASDGSIVFEADWDGEQIWVLRPGASAPTKVAEEFSNDNTPCVLPGGYIASLWLNRPGGSGLHELKVMSPDGTDFAVLLPDVDVLDVGLSCHALP